MGSSAQNSSGVHWCRRRVTFNRVPEKVPEKVPQKVWEALVQSQVRFNRVLEKVPGSLGGKPSQVQQGSGEGSGALVQSQVKFNRVPEKVPEKIPGGFGAAPGQLQRGSGEGSGEGLGGFGAAGQVQRGSGEGSGRFWRRFREALEKVWEALVQSQVRFNRVPEKVPEKV